MHHGYWLLGLCLCSVAAAQNWREIKPPPTRQNLSQIYQFVSALDPLDDPAKWTGSTHDQTAIATVGPAEGRQHGTKALRVQYEFTGKPGLEYVDIAGGVPIGDDVTAIGLWLKGGEHPLPARVRIVDAGGEVYQYDLGKLATGQWTLAVGSLDHPAVRWGGDNNSKLDRPIRLASFVFDKLGSPYVAKGEFTIAEFGAYRALPERLQPHGIRLFVPPAQAMLVYEPNQPIKLAVTAGGTASPAGSEPAETRPGRLAVPPARLSATLVDPFGKVLKEQAVTLRGETPTTLPLAVDLPGAYDLRLRVLGKEDDLDAPWADFRFAVLPKAQVDDDASPFGVSTHFGQSWPLSIMPLIARCGIKFIRDEIYWGAIETEKNQILIGDRFRNYIALAKQLGLEPLAIMDYANKLYDGGGFPTSPEARAGFARYAATVANELPSIRYFEIWNEWVGGCGMGYGGKPEDYAPLYLEAAQAIRAVRPEAKVIGIGGEWDGTHFEKMMGGGAGAAMDGFSVHPYMYPRLPGKSFAEHLRTDAARAEAAAGKPLPLWITEIGWPTQLGANGSDWLHQARCLVRMMLIALATETEKICWYDFKDDGLDLNYHEASFGLVHNEAYALAPKPAYVAYAHLINVLRGRKYQAMDRVDYLRGVVFRGARDAVWILWAKNDGRKVRPEFQLPSDARAEDMFGRPLKIGPQMMVGDDPVFLFVPAREQDD